MYIFDDCLSAVDVKKEKEILNNLIHKTKGKTTIISHRISSFKNTNKIIVLENGQVKEIGDHKKLISGKGFIQKCSNYSLKMLFHFLHIFDVELIKNA